MSTIPVFFHEVAIRLRVGLCVLLLQGWPTIQKPRTHFLLCCSKEPDHTHGRTWRTKPHLFLTHEHICLARFIANITHRQDNDRTLQGICSYACYLMRLLVYNYVRAAWNWAKSRMWLVSRRLAISVLLYSLSAQNENELAIECILICNSKLQALLLKCSKCKWRCYKSNCWYFKYIYLP